nr:PREDICTED: uncharacterized protein LOC103544808 [Equus przewalskii]
MISDCPLEGRSISSQSHEPPSRTNPENVWLDEGRWEANHGISARPADGHERPVSRAEGSRTGFAATCPRSSRGSKKPEHLTTPRRSVRTSGPPARHRTRGPGRWSTRQDGGPGGLAAAGAPRAHAPPRGGRRTAGGRRGTEGGWRDREERGAGKIRRTAGTAGPRRRVESSGRTARTPPVYLLTVSRPLELSLQSSFQLSLTVLVDYRSRAGI